MIVVIKKSSTKACKDRDLAARFENLIDNTGNQKELVVKIIARDKTSLDITGLKDKSLADFDNLPDPE
jgi:hypothetical protein